MTKDKQSGESLSAADKRYLKRFVIEEAESTLGSYTYPVVENLDFDEAEAQQDKHSRTGRDQLTLIKRARRAYEIVSKW